MQHICENFLPSATNSHSSALINKLALYTSFWYLTSISSSLIENYRDCGPVKKLTQAPNTWITQDTICGWIGGFFFVYGVSGFSKKFSRLLCCQVIFLLPIPMILRWKKQPIRKNSSALNPRLLSNATTCSSEAPNTTPSPYPPSALPAKI